MLPLGHGENGNKEGNGSKSSGKENEPMSSVQQQADNSSWHDDCSEHEPWQVWGIPVELQLHSSCNPNWGLLGT